MELRDLILRYRKTHHLSQREFAEKCGSISYGYIAIIEQNKNPNTGKTSEPSIEKLAAIARGLDMELSDLLNVLGKTPNPNPADALGIRAPEPITFPPDMLKRLDKAIAYTPARAMVPIIGTVRCGPGGLAYQDLQGSELADVANPQEYFWLRAEGDSMAPSIMPGDLVLVHIQPDVDSGALAVIIVDGEEGTLKKLIRKPNAVILQSFNQAYPPRVFVGDEINQIHIAGRVVETKRKW